MTPVSPLRPSASTHAPSGGVPADARNEPARQPLPQSDLPQAPRRIDQAEHTVPPRAALSELRQRCPSGPTTVSEPPPATPAAAFTDLMSQLGSGARVAGGYAATALIAASKLWVGAMAVSAGYRALRNPTDYLFHPVATSMRQPRLAGAPHNTPWIRGGPRCKPPTATTFRPTRPVIG